MRHPIMRRFEVVDAKDIEGFLSLLTDDHRLLFGARPAVVGKSDAREQVLAFWAAIGRLKHNVREIHEAGGAVLVESVVDYERLDGRIVHVPCCDVFVMRDGLIAETRAYLDQSPVWT